MTILVDGELVLYGFVGESYWGDGFTASEVLDALAEVGRDADITVRINSGGGYTDDGIAIYNALLAHKGDVAVVVDAMAASAASVIAMAGDSITMRAGALMMIHDPAGSTWGNAESHAKSVAQLNKLADLMAGIYADQSGEDAADIRTDMKAEIWLTGDEAVSRGFATETEGGQSKSVAAFDYRVYDNAPQKLVAMAKKENWSFKTEARKAASAASPPAKVKETPTMATQPAPADPNASAQSSAPLSAADVKARIKAITEDDAAQGCEGLAKHLAFDTDLPVDEALAALKASASDAPAPSGDEPVDPKGYQARRSAAADLAQPGGGAPAPKKTAATIDTSGIYAGRRAQKGV
ncbi:head maturation protease, ClpP-related [Yoonia sp. I 8.24]|uniref:head maturation protease, ClpP-related n=1 Tax=Yoonia sp. I 8.24 TaxID=1537229 RepID=UPI001EDE8DF1|nr:head maturation protease, ClpP-related [Yoonia sp. I 8.24]MCG3266105.1 Clp protease ClpP [Yoonia sp. I 8.24]